MPTSATNWKASQDGTIACSIQALSRSSLEIVENTIEAIATSLVGLRRSLSFSESLIQRIGAFNWPPKSIFEYLALSYVWGATAQSQKDINILQLDTTTLPELEKKDSLRKYSIPEVILDAINLCADLGYQYLWVDRLCIIQDDGSHKHSQINAMGSIYHIATLTIVSLGGCSSGGLPGASSRPRDTKEQFKRWRLSIDGRYSHALPLSIHDEVSASKWNQRGWTYQERVLSRRHLFVGENDFYLNCSSAIFESDSGWRIDHSLSPLYSDLMNVLVAGYETGIRRVKGSDDPTNMAIRQYMKAVTGYTARTLTFDQDTLNAFAGVGNLFAYQHHTDLLFGLPEQFFFLSLLWHHTGTWRPRNLGADISIPSWSWATWEGSVSYETQEWRYNNHANSLKVITADLGSLVTFYYVDRLRGLRQIQDDKLWFEWESLEFSDDSHTLQDQCEEIIGGHLRLRRLREMDTKISTKTDLPMDEWASMEMWRNCVQNPWKAIKHAEIRGEGGSLHRDFPGTLAFNTTVAALEVQEYPTAVVNNDHEASGNAPANLTRTNFNLVAGDNTVVGQVFANCREMVLRTLSNGTKYRVAALGACLSNEPLNSESWGLIVIILEEHEGIYRRLALGVVNLEAWTKLSPQWETVLLG